MAEPVLIPNSDYLGRSYDVVTMDPLNLGSTALDENVIDLDVTGDRTTTTHDGSFTIPAGVHHSAPYSGSARTESSVISSGEEFQQSFKRSVDVEAGVDGLFEFSGSQSYSEASKQARTRKTSFVYSTFYQENHKLTLDLANPKAPLRVSAEFADAVDDLPPQGYPGAFDQYLGVVKRFGTHYTTEIVLGGLAFQRTSGSATTFLKSSESEETLKAHAGVQIKALKAGANAEEARTQASQVDRANQLDRTTLEYRGGDGEPNGIDASWIHSLHELPAVVKAKLERISTLLTPRFFPDDEYIEDKRTLLDMAISAWILKKGEPGCGTAPLRYREPVVLALPWTGGKVVQLPSIEGGKRLNFPIRGGQPAYDSHESVALRLENADGHRADAVIQSGDMVKVKHIARDAYLGVEPPGHVIIEDNASKAATFTVLHHGENPLAPARLGEFFLETDRIILMTGRPGAPGSVLSIDPAGRYLHTWKAYAAGDPTIGFCLKRCATPGDDDDGLPESPLTT